MKKNNRAAFVGMVQCKVQSGPDGLPPSQDVTMSFEFIKAARKMFCNPSLCFAVVSLYCMMPSPLPLFLNN